MTLHDDGPDAPRWLRLAAAVSASPDAATLTRTRARLAARASTPAWLRWLARPATLATSAALLVLSAFVGSTLLGSSAGSSADETLASAELLGEDGSYGLTLDSGSANGSTLDSGGVAP